MITISPPEIKKSIYLDNKNSIQQYYSEAAQLTNCVFIQNDPFIFSSEGINYVVTKDPEFYTETFEYVLLSYRKPTRRLFEENKLQIRGWLKHPKFEDYSTDQIINSWGNNFRFIKEETNRSIKGLRPPQIGALYAILSHFQNAEEIGIVVMPTGTGKTETMLSTLIANECKKLLVAVPSDSLRTQISSKFLKLGLLRDFGIINDNVKNPIVGIIKHKFTDLNSLSDFIDECNVVVTTMNILSACQNDQKEYLANSFSHFFVDEAHHSQAKTWKEVIELFDKPKVLLFTATPYRNDGKKLTGEFIFKFSLNKAQEQGYYKQINYLPIREYNQTKADQKIAEKAINQLRLDIKNGFNHIVMARCVSKKRAIEVFEYYETHQDLNPVLIYNGISGLKQKIDAIKRKVHKIIVCVNMLGEGFDLPELKIAAVHDERQSLPVTLQFVGRFTRSSFNSLGNPSFVTNIAYPPIQRELNLLYAKDADWNLLLPIINENATQKEIDFQKFLNGFTNIENSQIPFQNIVPALSAVVFKNDSNDWNPNEWKKGVSNIDTFEHQYSNHNSEKNILVIVLGKIKKVDWGDFDTVQNIDWNLIVVYWDLRPNKNLIFVHTSLKNFSSENLVNSIFGSQNSMIRGMNVFRIFHEVKRLTLYNVGARKGIGKDVTFQSFFGKGVQDGIKELEQGTLIKNNIFGVGFRDGEKVSLGCSVKGKVWSYLRGNLSELTEWCKGIGDLLENETIDPNTVLENTLLPKTISSKPLVSPISIDWPSIMYEFAESRYTIIINGHNYDLSNTELEIAESEDGEPIKFNLICTDFIVRFEYILGINEIDGNNEAFYRINKVSDEIVMISYGITNELFTAFLQRNVPIIWFADGSHLFQNSHVVLKHIPPMIPTDKIESMNWDGVALNRESQGIAPYDTTSIQYNFIQKIASDFAIIYDDDGSGEIADVIGINDSRDKIDVHLFHLKYAKGGAISNDIDNFYQVCGQAQKALNWKYRSGKDFFDHLLKRKTKIKDGNSCSRIIKGSEDDIERLLNASKWSKEMKFHMYIVQPSLRKANASESILLLLGNTYQYLSALGDVNLKVYSS